MWRPCLPQVWPRRRNLFGNSVDHFGGREAWCDGVRGNVELGHFQREYFSEGNDPPLLAE